VGGLQLEVAHRVTSTLTRWRRHGARVGSRGTCLGKRSGLSCGWNSIRGMCGDESRRPYGTAGDVGGDGFPGFHPGLFSLAPYGSESASGRGSCGPTLRKVREGWAPSLVGKRERQVAHSLILLSVCPFQKAGSVPHSSRLFRDE
jgi:hypothetical protein